MRVKYENLASRRTPLTPAIQGVNHPGMPLITRSAWCPHTRAGQR